MSTDFFVDDDAVDATATATSAAIPTPSSASLPLPSGLRFLTLCPPVLAVGGVCRVLEIRNRNGAESEILAGARIDDKEGNLLSGTDEVRRCVLLPRLLG